MIVPLPIGGGWLREGSLIVGGVGIPAEIRFHARVVDPEPRSKPHLQAAMVACIVEHVIAPRTAGDCGSSRASLVLRIRPGATRLGRGSDRGNDMARGEMETCATLAAQVAAV